MNWSFRRFCDTLFQVNTHGVDSMSEELDFIQHYRAHGFAILRNAFDAAEMAVLSAETRRIYAEGLRHPSSYRDRNLYFDILPGRGKHERALLAAQWISWISPEFERHRTHQTYVDLFTPILGNDIKQVTQQIHWKPPGAKFTGFRFHQDVRFRENLDAFRDIKNSYLNVGLAIDPATRENGCLKVVSGSHKKGYLGLSDDSGVLRQGETHEDELREVGLDPADIVYLEMAPGDLAIWSQLAVHGSDANTSDTDRAFLISGIGRADKMDRGEWLCRNGCPIPLGLEPEICKYEELRSRPGPFHVKDDWFEDV